MNNNPSALRQVGLATSALLLFCCASLRGGPFGDPMVDPAGNIIANGDFRSKDPEQRPLRWVANRGPQTATVTLKQHHGAEKDDSSLELAATTTTQSVLVRSEKHIANPGTPYVANAWVKAINGAPAAFYLEFWDQNGVRIGVASTIPGLNAAWQPVKVSLTAPDNATHVSAAIGSTTNGSGVSYWDDVSLVPQIAYESRLEPGVRELFLDDYRLDSLVDVQWVVHPGKKTNPLISPTEPWEGRAVYIYGTVLKDQPKGSGYRMWYTALGGNYYLCYATSEDGITWHKPNLGIVDFKGSKENNITRVGGGSLIYDPDDGDASRRYKLMSYSSTPKEKAGYWVYFSPDGLHWTPHVWGTR